MSDEDTYQQIVWSPNQLQPTDPIPGSIQRRLIDLHPEMASRVARNQYLTPETFRYLLAQDRTTNQNLAAHNTALPLDLQHEVFQMGGAPLNFLAANPAVHPEIQHLAWDLDLPRVRQHLLKSPNLLECYQRIGAQSSDPDQHIELVQHNKVHPSAQLDLWRNPAVSENCLGRLLNFGTNLHPDILEEILSEQGNHVWSLSSNKNLGADILRRLWDEHPKTRNNLAGNPGLPSDLQKLFVANASDFPLVQRNPNLTFEQARRVQSSIKANHQLAYCTPYAEIQEELLKIPARREYLAGNSRLDPGVLGKLVLLATSSEPKLVRALAKNDQLRYTLSTPVLIVREGAPWLIAQAAQDAGVSTKEAEDLSENWRGSLGDLIEAVRLTRR